MTGRRSGYEMAVVPVGSGTPPGNRPFLVTVPGREAPVYRFDLPKGVGGAARMRVARQQLSDRLGGAAEALDILPLGPTSQWATAVVCASEARQRWCSDALSQNRRCRAVMPDFMALPGGAGHLVIDTSGGAVVARVGDSDGFNVPEALASVALKSALNDVGELRAAFIGPEVNEGLRNEISEAGLTIVSTASGLAPAGGLDLRTIAASDAAADVATLRLWLWVAVVSVLAFGLWAASVWVETRGLQSRTDDVRAQTMELLREGLVPEGPILDVEQQVTRALQSANDPADPRGPASPADILSRATVAVFGKGVTVETLRYDANLGVTLEIVATDFAAVDQLVSEMRASSLAAEASGLRARDAGGVSARILIREEAP